MKKIFLLLVLLSIFDLLSAQIIGIGSATPNASSVLEIGSTNKGLLIPRMTTLELYAIVNPAKGLMVYDSTKSQLMINMGTASPNWQTVVFKSGWSIIGNNGISSAEFIGTTDNKPFKIRINNQPAGKLDTPALGNIFWGYQAGGLDLAQTGVFNVAIGQWSLYSRTYASQNIAIGKSSLYNIVEGEANVAIGIEALNTGVGSSGGIAIGQRAMQYCNNSPGPYLNSNIAIGVDALRGSPDPASNTGLNNIAIGYASLFNLSTGGGNIAIGYSTLFLTDTGSHNTAIGYTALRSNTSAFNTGIGEEALYYNTVGEYNIALGSVSLKSNTTGSFNTAAGFYSLNSNRTGDYNTAFGTNALFYNEKFYNTGIGYHALANNINSDYNTALGFLAGDSYNNGSGNVFIGATADVNTTGVYNAIALGVGTTFTASNIARFGNSTTGSYGGWAGWTIINDGRFKRDIQENVPGLDFINKLRPITYHLAATELDAFLHKDDTSAISASAKEFRSLALNEKEKIRYTGFIAQEVETVTKALGFDFSGVDPAKNENDTYGLRYDEFVVPLIKAAQELSKQNEALKKQNEELLKRLEKLELTVVKK